MATVTEKLTILSNVTSTQPTKKMISKGTTVTKATVMRKRNKLV